MRRARIKAVATVPTRRKNALDTVSTETLSPNTSEAKKTTPLIEVQDSTLTTIERIQHDDQQSQQYGSVVSPLNKISDTLEKSNAEGLGVEESKDASDQPRSELAQNVGQLVEVSSLLDVVSPSKVQARSCFMRPTPRLDNSGRIRKNSSQGSGASASESEDDSRRVVITGANCVKNDSICSVQNAKVANTVTQNVPVKIKTGPKRRMIVSESARKLAEARREFLLRHENKTPDRNKLTMYDLIYYNPVTNPMKKRKITAKEATRTASIIQSVPPVEDEEEQLEDDPLAMPVPQVKVGPDGQLIIDEQSLVIEQTDAKKNREAIAKEAIIDDENNGGGFYKKRQKRKDWPKWETLKFYKALNTVGTDFLLMQTLFPNRTRQEIKLKYKKEEKINRKLVEKALLYHQEFDIEILEKQLATFEAEQDGSLAQDKPKQSDSKQQTRVQGKRRKINRLAAASIAEMSTSEDEQETYIISDKEDTEGNNGQSSEKDSEEDLEEAPHSDNSSDSETEIYQVRPTRSGRLPKMRKLQGPDINTLDHPKSSAADNETEVSQNGSKELKEDISTRIETRCPDAITTAIPDISKVEPGSLVILAKESPEDPGETVLQVYMVSSNMNSSSAQREITPVDLSPELLATVTTKLTDVQPVSVKEEIESESI